MNRGELEQRAIEAAVQCLKTNGYIGLVDVLIELGKLSRQDHERWRCRQIPYLEKVLQTNLARINTIIRAVQENSRRENLRASWTAYVSWGKGKRQLLRFSKSGHPELERVYATHYVRPGKNVSGAAGRSIRAKPLNELPPATLQNPQSL